MKIEIFPKNRYLVKHRLDFHRTCTGIPLVGLRHVLIFLVIKLVCRFSFELVDEVDPAD